MPPQSPTIENAAESRQPNASALTPEQMVAIQTARRKSRKVRRAATVAAISGWSIAVFAFFTLLSGIFSIAALVLGVAMCAVATIEILGSRALKQLDRQAPRRLALNQLGFGLALSAYAAWGIYLALTQPGPYAEQLAQGGDVAASIQPIADLHRSIMLAVYGAMIAISLVACGAASAYYFSRRKHVDTLVNETPDWVVATLRVAS